MKRILIAAAVLLLVVGAGLSYVPADILRPAIQRALERGLGRPVEIGDVYISPLSGLGFKLENVTIHEDPHAGIEPFAYVQSLEAHLRPLRLLQGRLEFSSLRLNEASVNIVKTSSGPWNFQYLLNAPGAGLDPTRALPGIRMRGGRVNFKFEDRTSVVYFNDADLDVSPASDGSMELRFSGAPSRTDRAAQTFGHFFVRGFSRPSPAGPKFDLRAELEPSSVEEVARLFDRGSFQVHGNVALDAQLSGTSSHLDIMGQLRLADVHRADLPPQSGSWRWDYRGTLNLRDEKLELVSAAAIPNAPVAFRFRASNWLSTPQWDAAADWNAVPVGALLDAARHLGVTIPGDVSASVSGSLSYSDVAGPAGRVEMKDVEISIPGGTSIRSANVALKLDRDSVALDPATVHIGDDESVDIAGSYSLNPPSEIVAKVSTKGLAISDMRVFGAGSLPLFRQLDQGTWRGAVQVHWKMVAANLPSVSSGAAHAGGENGYAPSAGQPDWSGEYELLNTRVAVDGLADPVRIQSAAVALSGPRVTVTRLRAKLGSIAFTGDYRWEPGAVRPHRFRVAVPSADVAELKRLLAPILVRGGGFLARTLGIGSSPAPEWLTARRADGTLTIDKLSVGELKGRLDSAHVLWDGELLRVTGVSANLDQSALSGDLAVDLSGRLPAYRFEGKVTDVAYKGGHVDFDGDIEARGENADLLDTLHGEGTLRGRGIAFAADADFRSIAGGFELIAAPGGPHWKFTGLEVTQGSETYSGQGGTQPDGRLLLELASRGRQFRYTGTLAAMAPQP